MNIWLRIWEICFPCINIWNWRCIYIDLWMIIFHPFTMNFKKKRNKERKKERNDIQDLGEYFSSGPYHFLKVTNKCYLVFWLELVFVDEPWMWGYPFGFFGLGAFPHSFGMGAFSPLYKVSDIFFFANPFTYFLPP